MPSSVRPSCTTPRAALSATSTSPALAVGGLFPPVTGTDTKVDTVLVEED